MALAGGIIIPVRTLIVSDIHSNAVAFEAVLADARDDGPVERVWCLGDVVGYGPEPMACIERLWDLDAVVISGNHDAVTVGRIDISAFNGPAAQAARWNGTRLSAEARDYLTALPETVAEAPFTLVHGTPRNPFWEYLTSGGQAEEAWSSIPTPHVLVGHTHFQFTCTRSRGVEQAGPRGRVVRLDGERLVVNPGSVGQPRDGDPRAAYAVFDDGDATLALRRTPYDIAATQRAMIDVGLPLPLIERLAHGR